MASVRDSCLIEQIDTKRFTMNTADLDLSDFPILQGLLQGLTTGEWKPGPTPPAPDPDIEPEWPPKDL